LKIGFAVLRNPGLGDGRGKPMGPTILARQLFMGLSTGMVTFLMAAGVTLIIAGLNVVNFGQGAFIMLGAFLCFAFTRLVGFWWALLLGSVIVTILGGLAELLLKPIYGKSLLYQMLVTLGIAFVLMDSMATIWGRDVKVVQVPPLINSTVSILGVSFPTYRIFIIVVAGIFSLGLLFIFAKTKLGMIFRAIISDREMVNCLGINVSLLFTIMFMFGIWLSGVAGVIMGPVIGIDSASAMDVLFSVMTVLIIGGITSMRGAFFSALIVGVIDAFGSLFLPWFYALLPGGLMIVVLLFKPNGLFASGDVSL
jgi:branched-subunit amino acid ABC-type transport system permease component